jgi:MoaA/NifB/PqqE/SkfB family radical SAM enzyme
MNTPDVLRAWGRILRGQRPTLSIEITRECPLRCPGCYAYEDNHVGDGVGLRQLSDYKGDELVRRVLELVDRLQPLHLSLVGGDPLVRYREVERLLPLLLGRGIHVQLVTSAFRSMPAAWATYDRFTLAVSIDGLQPEHDARRAPATYERILKNISNQRVTIHSTVTAQMMQRPGYLDEFLAYWAHLPQVERIWFSIFTPQRGQHPVEALSPAERLRLLSELSSLRKSYPKLHMPAALIAEFARPPQSPDECIFARTTRTISADLRSEVEPCQFGGDPNCSECGCIASMVLAAVGHHKLAGVIPVGALFRASARIGSSFQPKPRRPQTPFRVLQS